ncbi:uncharacterized protein LAJ45_11401 [Morchella importuna]|uniref:uncharacterized protein n=1 Tax=Morchella importuna TaxID=1174673 RepID=UPI001E8CBADB|nr:uncharacterized protein LAJ45_11401 [Morchella importuna]KAH8144567.1 hypothetical protein LAJ45_11401 [Morchella importuna]
MTLGLLNLPKVYTNIRNSLKAQMQNVGWVNKSVPGAAAFDALCLYVMNLCSLRAFLPIWTGVDSEARRVLADALKWLIGDVGQKEKLSRGQGNREYREAAGDSDDDDDGGQPAQRSRKRKRDPVSADLDRPSIMVTVVDPDALGAFFNVVPPPTYHWNYPQNEPSFIGILTKITFPELCNLILKHTAHSRAIRSIWGALDNVPPASNPPHQQPVAFARCPGRSGCSGRLVGKLSLQRYRQCSWRGLAHIIPPQRTLVRTTGPDTKY